MIHWFKKHPGYLRSQSELLSKDKNYKEVSQFRNNFFVSQGYFIVRYNGIKRFPFLIVFPEATPYAIPLFYPLNDNLISEETEYISGLPDVTAIEDRIYKQVRFFYELRHQNSSGQLCVLEWDNLDDGYKFYGLKSILKRVRDWCLGTINGIFPPDNQEVEFVSHFKNVNNEIELLYPGEFVENKLLEGDFYAGLYRFRAKNDYYVNDKYLYFGSIITGTYANGLRESRSYSFPFLSKQVSTLLEIITNERIINEAVEKKELIRGFWFSLNIEPSPFLSFEQLIEIIGDGDFEKGAIRLYKVCFSYIQYVPEKLFIGIKFPNRKGTFEFQIFKVIKKTEPLPLIITNDVLEKILSIIKFYEKVEAIPCEKISDENYFDRNFKRADYNILRNKEINVLGVGALGSEIADCISKAGVGRILLVDNQVFKAHNAVRHLAGIDNVGKSKVAGVAEIIVNHNPFIDIGIATYNVLANDLNDYINQNTLSISSIADDNVEGFINEQAVISGKHFFYVRALRGGKVGRIFRVIPGKDACLNCLDLYRKEKVFFIDIDADADFPTLRNECNNPIRPASAADLKIISSIASRIIIDHLQAGESEHNHWIWSTEDLTSVGLKSYQISPQSISVHPKCYYCNHPQKLIVNIDRQVLQYMQNLVVEDINIETGGVLAGYITTEGTAHITHASPPGPNAKQSRTNFEKDIKFCQQFLDQLYRDYGNKAVYLGEWHSHPSTDNQPSSTDIKSLTEISYQKEYLTDKPMMIIFSNAGTPSCTVHPTGKSFYKVELNIITA